MTKDGECHGQEEETKRQGRACVRLREEPKERQGAHPRTWIGIGFRREDPRGL